MQCKRTSEGLEWPITRKVDYDLRNWPPCKKKRKSSARMSSIKNAKNVYKH